MMRRNRFWLASTHWWMKAADSSLVNSLVPPETRPSFYRFLSAQASIATITSSMIYQQKPRAALTTDTEVRKKKEMKRCTRVTRIDWLKVTLVSQRSQWNSEVGLNTRGGRGAPSEDLLLKEDLLKALRSCVVEVAKLTV